MSSSEGDDTLEPHILEKFEVIELLGKGAYGVVWKVEDKLTGEIVALKKIFKAFQNATDSQRTYREVHLLRQLKHEHIIKLNHIIKAENGEDIYLVFEYMDSDLHYAIRTGILEEDHKRYLVYQMLKGLLYIHSANVIHRDIKPENMLIDTSCELKIADFGLSRSIDEGQDDENMPMTDYVATRWYRSPEILFGSPTYTKGVDMWAVGCIVAELYGERPIFPGKSTIDQLARIIEVTGRPTESQLESASLGSKYTSKMMNSIPRVIHRSLAAIYPQCDDDAIDFMERCFKFDPNERIDIHEALAHPYVQDFREEDEEITCDHTISIPISDNIRKQMDVYRDALYELCDNWQGKPEELNEIVAEKMEEKEERKRSRRKHRKERESAAGKDKEGSTGEEKTSDGKRRKKHRSKKKERGHRSKTSETNESGTTKKKKRTKDRESTTGSKKSSATKESKDRESTTSSKKSSSKTTSSSKKDSSVKKDSKESSKRKKK